MPQAKDELKEMARSLGFEVHYSGPKIWVNRKILGGRFSRCFIDYDNDEESLRKYVGKWLEMWAPIFKVFDSSAVKESGNAPVLLMGFKENE